MGTVLLRRNNDVRRILVILTITATLLTTWQSALVALPGDTQRVSVTSDEVQGGGLNGYPAVSDDGRFVAFEASTELSPGAYVDGQIYVRDLVAGATELVSSSSTGVPGDDWSWGASISADGRYVAFASEADNLDPLDLNSGYDVFVRDRVTKTTRIVSVETGGGPLSGASDYPSISDDGSRVAFEHTGRVANSVYVDRSTYIYVRDIAAGTTKNVSIGSSGPTAVQHSFDPAISGNGKRVAFYSWTSHLVPGDTNGEEDVFVADIQSGALTLVSKSSSGVQGNSGSYEPVISDDGTKVVFTSWAAGLVAGDGDDDDVFMHDISTGQTTLVSKSYDQQGNNDSWYPSISGDGRYVSFVSRATNLVAEDTNEQPDVFLHDAATGISRRVSVASDGAQSDHWSDASAVSDGGRVVVFDSRATNLVAGDTNEAWDVFTHEVDLARWPRKFNFKGGPPGQEGPRTNPQNFFVYDETANGLRADNPVVGAVHAVANRRGEDVLEIHLDVRGIAPNCELTVELATQAEVHNGGLFEWGRLGSWGTYTLGTFTTNDSGDGTFLFDGDVLPHHPNEYSTELEQRFGYLDLEDLRGTCVEADGTNVTPNEYGAAPQPSENKPFTWFG